MRCANKSFGKVRDMRQLNYWKPEFAPARTRDQKPIKMSRYSPLRADPYLVEEPMSQNEWMRPYPRQLSSEPRSPLTTRGHLLPSRGGGSGGLRRRERYVRRYDACRFSHRRAKAASTQRLHHGRSQQVDRSTPEQQRPRRHGAATYETS